MSSEIGHSMPSSDALAPSAIPRVDLQAQYLAHQEELDQAIARVLQSGRYTLGPEVAAFELEFANYLGVPEVVSVANGTSAIVLALRMLGVGPGDEVITTPFTAAPTIGAIAEAGAAPVLVDIDPETYLIDFDAVVGAVTPHSRAVVPVHIFGNVVDIPELRRRLDASIGIVEDAAQAHGSRLGEVHAGAMGDFGTFSFYPTKNLGGYGDGGAIASREPELSERLRSLRNHGQVDKDTWTMLGSNSRLDELQAAILRVKLNHLDQMNAARARLAARYMEVLPAARFQPQRIPARVSSNWHIFEARFDGDRDGLIAHLQRHGIQSNVYYVIPHHLQPALSHLGYRAGSLPSAETVCREAIALPLYPEMALETVDRVADVIHTFADMRMSV